MFGEVDQDDFDLQVKAVAGKITAETKTLRSKFLNYSNINRKENFAFSKTMLDLLSHISPNLRKSLPAAMNGSIITKILKNQLSYVNVWWVVKNL